MVGFEFLYQSGHNWHRAAVEEQEMCVAAAEVIWRRSWQMLTGQMSVDEAARMVIEKPFALASAARLAGVAVAGGGDAAAITRAAIRPLHREACENARRLRSQAGPTPLNG